MKNHSHTKIHFRELRKSHFLLFFCSKIYGFAPQNYGAMQTFPRKIQILRSLPRKITETSFFAPPNHGDFVLCPAKLWSNADFAPQNDGDIVSGANKYHQSYLCSLFSHYFCKSLSFPRSLQPFGTPFKEKIFCVTVPLSRRPFLQFPPNTLFSF